MRSDGYNEMVAVNNFKVQCQLQKFVLLHKSLNVFAKGIFILSTSGSDGRLTGPFVFSKKGDSAVQQLNMTEGTKADSGCLDLLRIFRQSVLHSPSSI